MKPYSKYDDYLLESLKNEKEALGYLNACYEDKKHPEVFLLALRKVANAWGVKMSEVAETSGQNRQSLYKTLSKEGNPEYYSLRSILESLGIGISFYKKKKTV